MKIKLLLVLLLFSSKVNADFADDITQIWGLAFIGLMYQIMRTAIIDGRVIQCHNYVKEIQDEANSIVNEEVRKKITDQSIRLDDICSHYKPHIWEYVVIGTLMLFLCYKGCKALNNLYLADRGANPPPPPGVV